MAHPLDFARVVTRSLRTFVDLHRKTSSLERFEEFRERIQNAYNRYYKALAGFEPGIDRALLAQQLVEQAIKGTPDIQPTCTRGCGACCHLEVEVTTDEGKLLEGLIKEGIPIDRDRLAVQASRRRRDPQWNVPLQASNRCVFLNEKQECSIYDYRPLSCRKHMVSSPPENCARGSQVLPIALPLAEIAMSAALSQPGNTATSLAKSLRALVPRKKKGEASSPQTELPPVEL